MDCPTVITDSELTTGESLELCEIKQAETNSYRTKVKCEGRPEVCVCTQSEPVGVSEQTTFNPNNTEGVGKVCVLWSPWSSSDGQCCFVSCCWRPCWLCSSSSAPSGYVSFLRLSAMLTPPLLLSHTHWLRQLL